VPWINLFRGTETEPRPRPDPLLWSPSPDLLPCSPSSDPLLWSPRPDPLLWSPIPDPLRVSAWTPIPCMRPWRHKPDVPQGVSTSKWKIRMSHIVLLFVVDLLITFCLRFQKKGSRKENLKKEPGRKTGMCLGWWGGVGVWGTGLNVSEDKERTCMTSYLKW